MSSKPYASGPASPVLTLFNQTPHTKLREKYMPKTKNVDEALKLFAAKDIKFVDLRFTDPRGKLQHVTVDVGLMNEEAFAEGIMFDASSIAGWKAINESDMTLLPDAETIQTDPFYAQATAAIF